MSTFKGYRILVNGRTIGASGKHYVYHKGDVVACPEGELDHLGADAVPVHESEPGATYQTAAMSADSTETRPVKPAPRKRTTRKASTAKK